MSILKQRRGYWLLMLALVAVLSVGAVACGDDDDDDDDENTPAATNTTGGAATQKPTQDSGGEIDYGKLSGNIDIDGSSTVFPISVAMAEEFGKASKVRVNVGLSGTGGGFQVFCRGETQISDASRPIKDSEVQACTDGGIKDLIEFQVAIDALTIVVNPENDWVTCLTVDQVAMIFKEGGAKKWSDVDPSWPSEDIKTYYPGSDSGTFDYFEEVLTGVDKANVHVTSGTSSEDDNLLVRGVEGNKNAIGYFGLAYYVEAGKELTAVEIDNGKGKGCVAPSAETAQSGEYVPYSRPLFMYTAAAILEERPEVVGFINFYFEELEAIVDEAGYATMSEDLKEEQWAKLEPFLP